MKRLLAALLWPVKWRMKLLGDLYLRPAMRVTGTLLVFVGVMILGAAALSGCAPRIVATKVPDPEELRECIRAELGPPLPADASVIDLYVDTALFSVRQEEAFNSCKAKHEARGKIISDYNRAVEKATKRWWEVWK